MTRILFIFVVTLFSFCSPSNESKSDMNWVGLSKEKIDLSLPLLTVRGSKGFLACAYINVAVCEKTQEACAIVSGVNTHEDMLLKEIKAVSSKAEALGLKVGMTGKEALELLR